MDLPDNGINGFLELLASEKPAPGGGAAAALAGCLGCALVEMVVALTKGKQKYAEFEPLMIEIGEQAETLRAKLTAAVDKDAEAFGMVSDAYKMEKQTEEQKELRKSAIEDALKKASDTPLELMRLARDTILLCRKAVGRSNPNVASDLEVSAVLLKAAANSAYINVIVNISALEDKSFAESHRAECRRLLEEIDAAAKGITAAL